MTPHQQLEQNWRQIAKNLRINGVFKKTTDKLRAETYLKCADQLAAVTAAEETPK